VALAGVKLLVICRRVKGRHKAGSSQIVSCDFMKLGRLVLWFVLYPSGAINKQLLQAHLQKSRTSVAAFEHQIETALTQRFVMDLVQGALYIPSL
jgi:hypothetical protein